MSTKNLSELFNQCVFRIPDYQRGYAWTEKQLSELWDDLDDISEINGEFRKHYTGTIYLEEAIPTDGEKWITATKFYNVVDGQQRLTTISILLHELIQVAGQGYCEERKEDLTKKFMFLSNLSGVSRIYRFCYVESDKNFSFLLHAIFEDEKVILPKYHQNHYTNNLKNAKEYFKNKLVDWGHDRREVLFKKITTSLQFDIRTIEKDLDVQAVFETMNNRGKPLSTLEKLKNRLIYLAVRLNGSVEDKQNLRKKINDSWGKIYSSLAENPNHILDEDTFLSAHLSLYRKPKDSTFSEKAAEEKVFEMFCGRPEKFELDEGGEKEAPVTYQKIEDYILKLSELAPIWYDIHFSKTVLVRKILTLNASKDIKIFLASIFLAKPSSFQLEIILRNVESILFRNSIPGIAVLDERTTATWARDLYNQEDSVSSILQRMIELIKTEINMHSVITQFRNLFTYERGNKGFHKWRGIKYFLFEYDEQLRKEAKEHSSKVSLDDFDKTTIEHIIPQRYEEHWSNEIDVFTDCFVSADQRNMAKKVIIHTLGNLTILKDGKNSALGNRSWKEKKERFRTGSYNEIEISANNQWTIENIEERGMKMLRFLESLVVGLKFTKEEVDQMLFSELYIINRMNEISKRVPI